MKKFTATITLEFEESTSPAAVREYIESAIQTECGFRNYDNDPTAWLIRPSVVVKMHRAERVPA